MLSYMLKNIPAKYAFAGYNVRKGLSVMTTQVGNKVVYDIFQYSYIDNYLSFYVLMDDGSYQNVELGCKVPEAKAEDIMSKHLYRGPSSDASDYEHFDKDKIVSVFGVRDVETLMYQADEIAKHDEGNHDVSLQAVLDVKSQYMGMEVIGVINRFNKYLKYEKRSLPVPAITYGPDDEYVSIIGDEMDFFDFMSNKSSDQIVLDIQSLVLNTDGIGNVKRGTVVKVIKGSEDKAGAVEIVNGQ